MIKVFFKLSLFLSIVATFSCSRPETIEFDPNIVFEDSIINSLKDLTYQNPDSTIEVINFYQNDDSIIDKDSSFFYTLEFVRSQTLFYQGKIDSAIFCFQKCQNHYENDFTDNGRNTYCKILYNLAYTYTNLTKHDSAIVYFDKAINSALESNLLNIAIPGYIIKTKIYSDFEDYGKAIESIEKSISLCHETKDTSQLISSLQAYADVYVNCHFFDEAKKQFNEVLKYSKHFNADSKFAHYNSKGRMYYLNEEYTKSKDEFLKSFDVAQSLDIYSQTIVTMNLAEVSMYLDDLESAKRYLELLEEKNAVIYSAPTFEFYYYSLLGEYQRRNLNYAEAKRLLAAADSIASIITLDNVMHKLHLTRKAEFNSSIGDYKGAYTELQNLNKVNKIILDENNRKQVSALQYKYQRDTTLIAQKNQILIKDEELKSFRSRQLVILIIAIALLLTIVGVYFYFRKRKQLAYEQNMKKVASLKMESMRGRLSPHFLFNVLNNIWASFENDKEASRNQFNNLTLLIRKSLINTDEVSIPLKEEIAFVKSFTELQKHRMENKIEILWDIDSVLEDLHVPGMILQIPVENAIKHGLAPKGSKGTLTIDAFKENNKMHLRIIDDGVGRNRPSIAKGTGTGIKVLNSTIYLLNQINDKKMTMKIVDINQNNKTGTQVDIEIPIGFDFNLNK
nr:histidine kinase [uncultured Draconibacterium sp.]